MTGMGKRINGAILLVMSVAFGPIWAHAGDLHITVQKFRSPQGVVHISVYDGEQSYDAEDDAVRMVSIPVEEAMRGMTFDGLAGGEYAVTLYHDENDNGDLDMNFFGIPTEGYGFSNNAKPVFSKPDFDRVKVVVGDFDRTEAIIDIQYW